MKRIYLIDCPGVVPPNQGDSEEDILLRGVVRVENVQNPAQYVAAALRRCKKQHVERTYDIRGWEDHVDFLELLARKSGRLLKGGEADADGVAKMVLNDFLRGKIPWFTPPPMIDGDGEKGFGGRSGALGEMGSRKRKREGDDGPKEDVTRAADVSTNAANIETGNEAEEESHDGEEVEDFAGFDEAEEQEDSLTTESSHLGSDDIASAEESPEPGGVAVNGVGLES